MQILGAYETKIRQVARCFVATLSPSILKKAKMQEGERVVVESPGPGRIIITAMSEYDYPEKGTTKR